MLLAELPGCRVERFADHILTTLHDGASSANWPHPDDPSYVAVARQCGFDDLMAYTAEHEVLHSLVPLRLYGRPSYVIRMAAHGRKADLGAAMMEERQVYYLQRFLADPAFPCPDPQWWGIVQEMTALRKGWS